MAGRKEMTPSKKDLDKILKIYNGSASVYKMPTISKRPVSIICGTGTIAPNTTATQLVSEVRKAK